MRTLYFKELIEEEPILVMEKYDRSTSEHKHSFFEFVYVLEGEALHRFGDKTDIIRRGDYFLVDLDRSHQYVRSDSVEPFHIINCLFLPQFIDDSLKGVNSFREIIRNYLIRYDYNCREEQPTRKIFHDDSGFVRMIIENILQEFQEKRPGYSDIIRHLLLTLIIYLVRGEIAMPDERKAVTVRQVCEYVEKNYMNPIRLSDICERMNFSLSYISMLFRTETGMTFRQYLLKFRMEKACLLLRISDLTVSDISRLVGYSDPAFFYKAFRRFTGMTPDEYRASSHQ